jgi:Cys-tRNA(Pro)/Cys-tRNA(Cys) deacylase
MDKTNVMRLLDAAKIEYVERTYDAELTDGESIAKILGEDPECVFKTLVTASDKKEYFVFCVPVNGTLNLKKAAKAVGAKSIAMIHQKELLPLTGYVHGGCSPIGLKKPFPVTIDETAQLFDRVYVSGGRKGFQIGLSPTDLKEYCNANFCDILA